MISFQNNSRQADRCLLVEDEPLSREWMVQVVGEAFPDVPVVTAASLSAAHEELDRLKDTGGRFSLAIVDLGLPDGSGVDLVRRLAREHARTIPVVATIYDDDAHLFEAIGAGARGYLLKNEDLELLAGYLRRIERGEPPLSPAIAHRMLSHFRAPELSRDDQTALTLRETETLALLAKGLTVAEAAAHMGLTRQTVASYVKVIYQKLNVSSRAEATREAIRRGLS